MTDADAEQLAQIEAALREYEALLKQGEELYHYPIIDMVGAAEERDEEYAAIREKRMAVGRQFPDHLRWLLALVERLQQAGQGRDAHVGDDYAGYLEAAKRYHWSIMPYEDWLEWEPQQRQQALAQSIQRAEQDAAE